jgi:hypothetical protein
LNARAMQKELALQSKGSPQSKGYPFNQKHLTSTIPFSQFHFFWEFW